MMGGDDSPETQFAWLGEDQIAYEVFGEGDIDLLFVPTAGDTVGLRWWWPAYADWLRWLGTQARVVTFDRRGMGASDRPSGEPLPSWEQWADDALTVLDAVGSERAVLLGLGDGGPIAMLFAASHPDRTRGLILANTAAWVGAAPDAPDAPWSAALPGGETAMREFIVQTWGSSVLVEGAFPDASRDPAFLRWASCMLRLAYSPRDAAAYFAWTGQVDVRGALASVHVPTLVLHREGSQTYVFEHGRYLAERIPGARLAPLPGRDVQLWNEPSAPGVRYIEEFLAGLHGTTESDRALAAVLFTDFVGSTKQLSAVGDHAWRNLLDSHDVIARTVVEQHAGRLVRTTGDGILATFDGPGRAIRCATALRDALRPLGVEIRAGLHTGEIELRGPEIAGIAVHIAARVLELAEAGQLWVSAAVPMLVAGAGFEFDDRGQHNLKGIDGTWQLWAART